ncbi:Hpt domain-containing protein [uncultured Oscillibacter sp.]|uniref:Hpt domain-containing protein n=1 Tax=uncultured Oscillibacter sp. TaxID=876091 RepID=UPI0025F731FC|nr:Hpt domain-containing protein [uncultured Oscillibacter sp.]
MTLKECYTLFSGDYEDTVRRLAGEARARRFALQFLADTNFSRLKTALRAGNRPEALRAAHSLKGLSLSLGFTNLGRSAAALLHPLHTGIPDNAQELLERVAEEHRRVTAALLALRGGC